MKCLIVDDVAVSRYASRKAMEKMSYEVIEAESIEGCLDAITKNRVDIVLLDWHLRRESGVSIINKIKQSPGNEKVAVIVCTGVEGQASIDDVRKMGADGFILKPITPDNIQAEVTRVVRKVASASDG
jgi:CheY-like chemotaxis protein